MKAINWIFALLLVLLLISGVSNTLQYGDNRALSKELGDKDREISNLAAENQGLREEVRLLNERIREFDVLLNDTESALRKREAMLGIEEERRIKAEQRSEGLNLSVKNLKETIGELNATIWELSSHLQNLSGTVEELNATVKDLNETVEELNTTNITNYAVLGVIDDEEGIVMPLLVEIKKGEGRLLLEVHDLYIDETAQNAVKKAYGVAQALTGEDLSDNDVIFQIFNVRGEPIFYEGESAGAAMTLALISGITGNEIDPRVMITGTIERDESIGRVTGIRKKAEAAVEAGATMLLVPKYQGFYMDEINITEVSNIEDAMSYILE